MPSSIVVTIDPGLTGTGVAIWDALLWDMVQVPPFKTFNIYPSHPDRYWTDKFRHITQELEGYILTSSNVPGLLEVKHVVCEFPDYWVGDAKGQAAMERGDILKLAALVGGFLSMANALGVAVPTVVSPREWKGQLGKEAVEARIVRHFGEDACRKYTSHTWDAVGIGMWAKGIQL